jgi:hypothetical protein
MPVKGFTIRVGHTVSLGSYEFLKAEAEVVMSDLEEGDWDSARQEAQEALRSLLMDSFREQAKPEWFDQIPVKRNRTR